MTHRRRLNEDNNDDKGNNHDEMDQESEDGENSTEEMDSFAGNEIQVEFEGRNPIDSDFDGIKQLLHQLLLKAHINTSELADLIIGQNFVGTALKQCDDDDEEDDDDEMYDSSTVFGIISAINIVHKRDKNCVKQLYDFLMEKLKPSDADTIKEFKDKLNDASNEVGFLLNERFVNIPPEISVPMLENLEKEIQRAKNKKMHFNFAYYLMIIKYYEKPADSANALEIIYSNSEEEIFCKEAIASFDYTVEIESDSGMAGKWDDDDPILKPMRKVILFEANKLPSIITTIKEFISE